MGTCHNVHGVMKSSNVIFSNASSLKKLSLENVMRCTNEMHSSSDGISEVTYDEITFDIDAD